MNKLNNTMHVCCVVMRCCVLSVYGFDSKFTAGVPLCRYLQSQLPFEVCIDVDLMTP